MTAPASNITPAYARNYWVVIKVRKKLGGEQVEFLKWNDLRYELRLKYDWYFKYRAALLQVKYPKYHVELAFGDEPVTQKQFEDVLLGKIAARKRKIAQHQSSLFAARQNWNELFPIEQHPDYVKATEKLNRLIKELEDLEDELLKHSNHA